MRTQQINLKLPVTLVKEAKKYAEIYGYRSLQELAADALREKIFEREEFDETFTEEEISLIDELIEKSIRRKKIKSEEDLEKALR
jgi:metal-responsive CopG/Arc/MetJ family transcriptional regulator